VQEPRRVVESWQDAGPSKKGKEKAKVVEDPQGHINQGMSGKQYDCWIDTKVFSDKGNVQTSRMVVARW